MTKRIVQTLWDCAVTFLVVLALMASLFAVHTFFSPSNAKADPGVGCETIQWGFLGSQRRTICDGPRRPDGSWERARVVWTPAGYVPATTSCYGRYSVSCTTYGGYYRDTTYQERTTYIVFDHNVVPGEPAWLPPGTDRVA